MKTKDKIILWSLMLVYSLMYVSGLPSLSLIKWTYKDVDSYILPLLVNFVLILGLTYLVIKGFKIDYDFEFGADKLSRGLKKYGPLGIFIGLIGTVAFTIGLLPFNNQPSIERILIEGLLYYVGVGIMEEFLVRGLFLNLLDPNKGKSAILISSLVFGLGHIFGMLGMDWKLIVLKVILTIGMGLYFAVIYKKTQSLWVVIALHAFIDICAFPFLFVKEMHYPLISIIILSITYIGLAIYSLFILERD